MIGGVFLQSPKRFSRRRRCCLPMPPCAARAACALPLRLPDAAAACADAPAVAARALKRLRDEEDSRFASPALLNERYVLSGLLGRGGFSEVHRAYDLAALTFVAVKVRGRCCCCCCGRRGAGAGAGDAVACKLLAAARLRGCCACGCRCACAPRSLEQSLTQRTQRAVRVCARSTSSTAAGARAARPATCATPCASTASTRRWRTPTSWRCVTSLR